MTFGIILLLTLGVLAPGDPELGGDGMVPSDSKVSYSAAVLLLVSFLVQT